MEDNDAQDTLVDNTPPAPSELALSLCPTRTRYVELNRVKVPSEGTVPVTVRLELTIAVPDSEPLPERVAGAGELALSFLKPEHVGGLHDGRLGW